jgi:hypothetical protein
MMNDVVKPAQKEVGMQRLIESTVPPMSGNWRTERIAADALHEGPWAPTVALANVLMRWVSKGPVTALVFAALGVLIGLLSRRYLPTRSIFELL